MTEEKIDPRVYENDADVRAKYAAEEANDKELDILAHDHDPLVRVYVTSRERANLEALPF